MAIRRKEFELLNFTSQDELAANCPKCFGPPVPCKTYPDEPSIILCLDGNFQQSRHMAASNPIPGYNPPTPEIFLDPAVVEDMGDRMRGGPARRREADEFVVSSISKLTLSASSPSR